MNKILQLFKLDLSQNRVFGLDILRFVAIFMVLLGHSMLFVPADIKPMFKQFLLDGVSIFFVLSGFLIGGILIKQLNREKPTFYGLLDFWKRRWMRYLFHCSASLRKHCSPGLALEGLCQVRNWLKRDWLRCLIHSQSPIPGKP